VLSARIGEHSDRTRFVIELSDPVRMRVFTLADPNRVVIDLPEVLWRLQDAARPTGKNAVKSYRYGPFRPGNSRFVIDLNSPVSVAEPMILPPQDGYGYRVVLDLFPTTQEKFAASAGWPADVRAREVAAENLAVATAPTTGLAGTPAPNAPVPGPRPSKKIIVLDAGHGGIDTGTTGINGTYEKDLVLDVALRLGRVLAKRGYEVHFTRSTDIYIPLGERVAISRADHADLFISLHADSNPDASVSGASVYTLSERGSDREAAALARKENQSDAIAGVDLTQQDSPVASILIDLAQRDTINRSSRFAVTALGQLGSATDILPREPHRSAAFVVLKAPDVPAVLIELGYQSNAHDAGQMSTSAWRDGVADAIAGAVDRNFAAVPTASVVPAQAQ
jgi:N-acetylmuramoyl-L-alanine amidase